MAELLALQDLQKKLLWATLKLGSPWGHPVSSSEQHPIPPPRVINTAIKIKGADEAFFSSNTICGNLSFTLKGFNYIL